MTRKPTDVQFPVPRLGFKTDTLVDGLIGEVLCEHYACRCARAAELAEMYDRTGDGRLLREAIGVHEQRVRCRLVQQ
jgi:hypothetical protein